MPGYAVNTQDVVKVTLASTTPPGWVSHVRCVDPAGWAWFTEDSTNLVVASASSGLPRAWFGVDLSKAGSPVMASVQCLQGDFCLDIQVQPRPR